MRQSPIGHSLKNSSLTWRGLLFVHFIVAQCSVEDADSVQHAAKSKRSAIALYG